MQVREGIGLMLLLLGLLRATLLVAHEPLLGYANQYDMYRTSACLGLYPDVASPASASPEAPLPVYRRDAPNRKECYPSSEVALGAAVLGITGSMHVEGKGIRLQWIGYAKLFVFLLSAALIAWALRGHWVASLVHGAIVLLVLSDPVVTLWFNSLYTEFAAIWALYASIGAACALAITERASPAMWTLLGTAVAALAFSREQFALLAPALVAVSWPWLWYRAKAMTVGVLVIALVSALVSFALIPRPDSVQRTNRVDTYLGLVAHSSADVTRALARLNLPERCASLVGASWYQARGENLEQVCPEVVGLSSFAFLRLASTEPETLARSLARALPAMQGVSIGYLGTRAGAERASFRELPWWAYSPLDAVATRLTSSTFAALVLAAIVVAPLALLVAIAWARPSSADVGVSLLFAMLLGGTILYAAVTTIFGDGLSEAARHFLVGSLAMYSALIAAAIGLPLVALRWRSIKAKQGAMEAVVALAAAAIVAVACWTALAWAEAQPLAIGFVEQPPARQASGAGFSVSGWVLDPSGVEAVRVHLGTIAKDARYGELRPDIRAAYPGYPDSGGAWFKLDLTKEELERAGAPGELRMRVVVRGRGGAATQIDHRTLAIVP